MHFVYVQHEPSMYGFPILHRDMSKMFLPLIYICAYFPQTNWWTGLELQLIHIWAIFKLTFMFQSIVHESEKRKNKWVVVPIETRWLLMARPHLTSGIGKPWWRHQMETFSALLALCARNSPVPVNSPHKGQWRGTLMFSLICAWINDWVNNHEAGDLRRHRCHYDVNVMQNGDLCWLR